MELCEKSGCNVFCTTAGKVYAQWYCDDHWLIVLLYWCKSEKRWRFATAKQMQECDRLRVRLPYEQTEFQQIALEKILRTGCLQGPGIQDECLCGSCIYSANPCAYADWAREHGDCYLQSKLS